MRLQFPRKNIYSDTAVVKSILRLRLTVQIRKLKYKLKSSKHKSVKYDLLFNKKNIYPF